MNINKLMFTSTLSPKYTIEIPGERECYIRCRTFNDLFINNTAADHFYIACVDDLSGTSRFYEARKAHCLLKRNFVDPTTKHTIITVTFYKASQLIRDEDQKCIVIMKQIKTCVTPENLSYLDEFFSNQAGASTGLAPAAAPQHEIDALKNILEKNPNDQEALSRIISIYVDVDSNLDAGPWLAIPFIQNALQQNPEDNYALKMLMHFCHYELVGPNGPLIDPIIYLENALTKNPNHRYALAKLVQCCSDNHYGGARNLEKTISRLERALETDPCDEYALHTIVTLYTQPPQGQRGNINAAGRYILAALNKDPTCKCALELFTLHKHNIYSDLATFLPHINEARENIEILSRYLEEKLTG